MNRPYNPEKFRKIINYIHAAINDASIGTDVMVGFPGESDKAFKNTYQLIESLPITYLHIFPFSSRPGTPASKFTDQIHPQIIKERRNKLILLGQSKKSAFLDSLIDKTMLVLVEGKRDLKTGLLTGLTANYARVLIKGEDHLKNRLIQCQIQKKVNDNKLLGIIVT